MAEQELDQTGFRLDAFLPYRLNRLAETISRAFQLHYQREFDLSRTQWRIMAHLASTESLTAKDIRARIHEDKVSVSRGVMGLEARGLLARSRRAKDRRFEDLSLTAEGRQLFAVLAGRARMFERELTAKLGAGLSADLARILTEVQPVLGWYDAEATGDDGAS